MVYIYLVISAALIPITNVFFDVLRESYSWWLVPVLFIGFFVALVLLHLLFAVAAILLINTKKPPKKGESFYRALFDSVLSILLKLLCIKIKITGLEKVPEDGRFLVVCNHQHDFDCAVILHAFPKAEIAFVAKKEIYKDKKFIARAMHKLNCFPIDRENNREAAKAIISATKYIKEDAGSVCIFPEGYVSKTTEILPLRNGAFKIAYKAKVPVVVCVVDGTRSIPKNVFRRGTKINFSVLDVIGPERFDEITTVEIGDIVHDKMVDALVEIRAGAGSKQAG